MLGLIDFVALETCFKWQVNGRSGFAYQIKEPSVGRPSVGCPIVRGCASRLAHWAASQSCIWHSYDLVRLICSTFFTPTNPEHYLIIRSFFFWDRHSRLCNFNKFYLWIFQITGSIPFRVQWRQVFVAKHRLRQSRWKPMSGNSDAGMQGSQLEPEKL